MRNILEQIAPHLLTVACYDREVLSNHFLLLSIYLFFLSAHYSFIFFHHVKNFDVLIRLTVEGQPQLHFRRMLEGKEITHMALTLWILQIIFHSLHEYTLTFMLLSLLLSMRAIFIHLLMNCCITRSVTGYALDLIFLFHWTCIHFPSIIIAVFILVFHVLLFNFTKFWYEYNSKEHPHHLLAAFWLDFFN